MHAYRQRDRQQHTVRCHTYCCLQFLSYFLRSYVITFLAVPDNSLFRLWTWHEPNFRMGWRTVKMKESALNQLLGSAAWKSISIVHESTHTHTHRYSAIITERQWKSTEITFHALFRLTDIKCSDKNWRYIECWLCVCVCVCVRVSVFMAVRLVLFLIAVNEW